MKVPCILHCGGRPDGCPSGSPANHGGQQLPSSYPRI